MLARFSPPCRDSRSIFSAALDLADGLAEIPRARIPDLKTVPGFGRESSRPDDERLYIMRARKSRVPQIPRGDTVELVSRPLVQPFHPHARFVSRKIREIAARNPGKNRENPRRISLDRPSRENGTHRFVGNWRSRGGNKKIGDFSSEGYFQRARFSVICPWRGFSEFSRRWGRRGFARPTRNFVGTRPIAAAYTDSCIRRISRSLDASEIRDARYHRWKMEE